MEEKKSEQGGGNKKKKMPRWFFAFAGVLVLLIVILIGVLLIKISGGSGPGIMSRSLPPAASFSADLSKLASSAELKLSTMGQAQINGVTIKSGASYAIYNPVQRQLELAFYPAPLPRELLDQLSRAESFSDLTQNTPSMLFLFTLRKNMVACDAAAIERYDVFVNKNSEGLGAAEYITLEFGDNQGIASFGCRLDQPGAVFAALQHAPQQQAGGTPEQGAPAAVSWDLRSVAQVFLVQVSSKLHYDSSQASSVIALLNKRDAQVNVGFFPQTVSAGDKKEMRKAKSLLAAGNKPAVEVVFYLNREATVFDLSSIMRYGVIFHRNPAANIDFPGAADKEGFYFVSRDRNDQLTDLSGIFGEGELIQGRMRHEGTKVLDQIPSKFSWELLFDTMLIDVFSEPADEDIPPQPVKTSDQQAAPEPDQSSPYATAAAGSVMVEFASTVALYYPAENDLAVGFYATELTPAEKEQVRKNKVLWQYVNNKRPNLVIIFDFRKGSQDAATQNMHGYTVYFTRDKIGSFYFPGEHDQINFPRMGEPQPGTGEIKSMSGQLAENGSLSLRMKGEHTTRGTKFTWNINETVPLSKVP